MRQDNRTLAGAPPAPISGPLTVVAVIGTIVGMLGVGHALYDALTPGEQGLQWFALAEALIAALFLEGVVMTSAGRARAAAADSRAARFDVGVVLVAAVLSGLISGLHAGWGTAGLFRLSVPIIAAAVWLGDVTAVLRTRRTTDHERALRLVLAAVGRRLRAEVAGYQWRLRRADTALVRAMQVYAALDGDRGELARRLNEMHHRADLLAPLGSSPWPAALPGQTAVADHPVTAVLGQVTGPVTASVSPAAELTDRPESVSGPAEPVTGHVDSDRSRQVSLPAGDRVTSPSTARVTSPVTGATAPLTSAVPVRDGVNGQPVSVGDRPARIPVRTVTGDRDGDRRGSAVTDLTGHGDRDGDRRGSAVTDLTGHGDRDGDRRGTVTDLTGHDDRQLWELTANGDAVVPPVTDLTGQVTDDDRERRLALLRETFPDEQPGVYELAEAVMDGRELSNPDAAAQLGTSVSTGGRRLRRARDIADQLARERAGRNGGARLLRAVPLRR